MLDSVKPEASALTTPKAAIPAANPVPRVAILWKYPSLGLYSNADFDSLYNGIGHNNGNLAFVYAIANQIENSVKFFGWSTSPDILRDNADIIVIPCANQLGKHTDFGEMATSLERSGLPVVAIGLGAHANSYEHDIELQEGTLRWARVIANSSQQANIYTRGAYTTSQLDKLGIEAVFPADAHPISSTENRVSAPRSTQTGRPSICPAPFRSRLAIRLG